MNIPREVVGRAVQQLINKKSIGEAAQQPWSEVCCYAVVTWLFKLLDLPIPPEFEIRSPQQTAEIQKILEDNELILAKAFASLSAVDQTQANWTETQESSSRNRFSLGNQTFHIENHGGVISVHQLERVKTPQDKLAGQYQSEYSTVAGPGFELPGVSAGQLRDMALRRYIDLSAARNERADLTGVNLRYVKNLRHLDFSHARLTLNNLAQIAVNKEIQNSKPPVMVDLTRAELVSQNTGDQGKEVAREIKLLNCDHLIISHELALELIKAGVDQQTVFDQYIDCQHEIYAQSEAGKIKIDGFSLENLRLFKRDLTLVDLSKIIPHCGPDIRDELHRAKLSTEDRFFNDLNGNAQHILRQVNPIISGFSLRAGDPRKPLISDFVALAGEIQTMHLQDGFLNDISLQTLFANGQAYYLKKDVNPGNSTSRLFAQPKQDQYDFFGTIALALYGNDQYQIAHYDSGRFPNEVILELFDRLPCSATEKEDWLKFMLNPEHETLSYPLEQYLTPQTSLAPELQE